MRSKKPAGREMESDALDALVSAQVGVAGRTIKNQRTKVREAGLIRMVPEKDDAGTVVRWLVRRTKAPR
jgi:hypothetical protein